MSNAYETAAEALRDSPLFVDPLARAEREEAGEPISEDEIAAMEAALADASTPIFVALLPEAARNAGDPATLAKAVGEDGTYVIGLGRSGDVDAVSNVISGASNGVKSIAATGFVDFVGNLVPALEDAAANGGGGGNNAGDSGGGSGGWLPLGILAAVGGGGFLLYRRNKRTKEIAQVQEVRQALDEDITAYGEQLSTLDLDVRANAAVPAEAQQEYGRALDLYETAKTASDRAERPGDLQPVTHALEEGRWLLSRVDARLKGTTPPERTLPCFFDPRHGPSVENIAWAPMGGTPREVPACAADAIRIREGQDPETRMVQVGDGDRRPYWEAGPAYGGWAGGYFGGFLPGMLMGTMLGSAMSGPAYVDGGSGDGGGGEGGGDGGGDWGGGFGGGDGGGGDWGGGFGGGGDFGGGFGD